MKVELEDLKVLETFLNHAIENIADGRYLGDAVGYVEDALAEIKRWKENGKRKD